MTDVRPFRPIVSGTQLPYDAPAYRSTHKRHPKAPLVRIPPTATGLGGPFFSPQHFAPIADLSVVVALRTPGGSESNAVQAPHLALAIFARDLQRHLTTRLYFAGEPLNAQDPVLLCVPEARWATLLAHSPHPGTWQRDIRLQGGDETVFLEV